MKKIFALLIAIFCVSTQIFADTVQGSTTTPDKGRPVSGDESSYYPYCDAPLGLAKKWELEKVGGDDEVTTAIDKVVSNQKVTIYDLTGRKIEKITSAGIYIINGNKVLVK